MAINLGNIIIPLLVAVGIIVLTGYILNKKAKYWKAHPKEYVKYKAKKRAERERKREEKRYIEREKTLAYERERSRLSAHDDFDAHKKWRNHVDSGGLAKDVNKSLRF